MPHGRLFKILATAATAFLLSAGAALPANVIDLAIEPADFLILGEATSDNLGRSLATGDINGDGVLDLLAVACNSQPLGGTRRGTLYIFWGDQLGQQSVLDLALGPAGVSRILGKASDDYLFCNVATGDFNNDGCDEIIWGQPLSSDHANWGGKAYVVFGSPSFPALLDLGVNPPGVMTFYGDVENGTLGQAACSCDVNGDGYDDIVLTAPWLIYSEVFVLLGGDVFPWSWSTNGGEAGMIRIVDHTPNTFVNGVACRDVNADGYDDLVLGASDANPERVMLLYGSATLSETDSLMLAAPSVPMKVILGQYAHGGLGADLAFGDLNGDQRIDLVAGSYTADPPGCVSDCGEVYVFYDVNALPDTIYLASTTVPMTRIVGFGTTRKYGFRVMCDDLSGDSVDDLVITNLPINYRATTIALPGRSIMPSTVLLASESGPLVRVHEAVKGDGLGWGVTSFDLDADDTRDLIVGAPYADPQGRNNGGTIYGIFSPHLVTGVVDGRVPGFTVTNFPNPFSRNTTVSFDNVPGGDVELTVYDVAGRRVFGAMIASHRGGAIEFLWHGLDDRGKELPSGVYFCRAQAGGTTETRKMVLVR